MINFIILLTNITSLVNIILLLTMISACAQSQPNSNTINNSSNVYKNSQSLDDSQALAAQMQQAIKREITVTAPVKKILPEDVKGLPHQRFLIELSNDSTVLIAHDLQYAKALPIQAGDIVCVRGEYIWNKKGGLIHWTHHSDTPKHEGGWIDFQGQRYQ